VTVRRRWKNGRGIAPDIEISVSVVHLHPGLVSELTSGPADWYKNKEMHEGWLLPALNPYCTKIRPDWFKLARKETNTVESQHAHTNQQTHTQLSLLIAIEK
jgi:hypothetical protein